jgi:hypothetical protein
MYCPRCWRHVDSNNVRFCPGCGLWLQGVVELVANNGLVTRSAAADPKPQRSLVKRGALLGATLMFASFFLTLAILPHAGKKAPVLVVFFFYWVALMAFIGMSGYLRRLITKIFNLFSEDEHSPSKKIAYTLPSAYSAPGADPYRQFVDTAKMGQPSSVAEQTTSRLNNV